jgi:hypothetical protein
MSSNSLRAVSASGVAVVATGHAVRLGIVRASEVTGQTRNLGCGTGGNFGEERSGLGRGGMVAGNSWFHWHEAIGD